jgi:DNA-binding transcriptional ArsR family regulator
MKALAHPIRIEILQLLDQIGETDKDTICTNLPHKRESLLAHLRVLLLANVISVDGRSRYTVNYPLIEKATSAVARFNSLSQSIE